MVKQSKKQTLGLTTDGGVRQAFVQAGLKLFGEYGLTGTSTRMLAKEAEANISGIAYYFESKEKLYQAVVQFIVDRFNEVTGPARLEIWQKIHEPLSRPELLVLFKNLISAISNILNEDELVRGAEKILLREQVNPSPAFELLYQGYIKDVVALLTRLIGLYLGVDPKAGQTFIRAHTIVGQILAFVGTRWVLLKNMGISELTPEHRKLILHNILVNAESCLKAWADEEGGR